MKTVFKLSKILNKLDKSFAADIKDAVNSSKLDIEEVEVLRKDWAPEYEESIVKGGIKLEEGSRTAVKYVSVRTVDQVGDVVMPKGIDFKQYKKVGAPVFYNHNYSLPQIGADEKITVDDWGVKVKMRYADTGEGTLANILWNLTSQNMNKQSSVGIIPLEVIRIGDNDFKAALKTLAKEWPEFRKSMKGCRRIITRSLFLEHSDVSMACNTDTETLAVSKSFIEAGAGEEILKRLGLPVSILDNQIDITKGCESNESNESNDTEEIEESDDNGTNEEADKEEVTIDDETENTEEIEEIPEIEIPEIEEIEEKIIKVEKVTMVKEPQTVKMVQSPVISKNALNTMIKDEIRRKMGRLV